MKIRIFLSLIFLLIFIACQRHSIDQLAVGFQEPPENVKPWLYWYWIDENISKEGITKDLEAMARVGIGQALIGHVSPGGQRGDVEILSENWWQMVEHAVAEGDRLGVDIGFFNGPGWSQSGGPWIKKENSMRHIVSKEIKISGPTIFEDIISYPDSLFELVALQAYPAFAVSEGDISPHVEIKNISSMPVLDDLKSLIDKDEYTSRRFPAGLRNGQDLVLDIQLDNPANIRSIQFDYLPIPFKVHVELEARKIDGGYYSVRSFTLDRRYINFEIGPMRFQPAVFSLPATQTDKIRIRFSNLTSDLGAGLKEICLKTGHVLDQAIEKQLGKMYSGPLPPWDGYLWEEPKKSLSGESISSEEAVSEGIIDISTIIDLSSKIDTDGRLNWEVPEGDWIISLTGMVPTGATNVPVPPEATGFECDKFTLEAIEAHFNGFIGNFLDRVPPDKRKSFKTVVIDSYEVGPQNWTDNFREIFLERYGYDPIPWLPVFRSRIVENTDKSNRFLWDLRRLTADLIADVYVARLKEMCNEQGLDLWVENYGHWGFPAEFLQYGGRADKISGEFWYENHLWDLGPLECRAASSAAHIYGKSQVFAEAFTAGFNFKQYPASMKSRGDQMFCEGINHMVQHVYIHQPWENRIPGVIAWFGMSYQRHNTWFEQSHSWNEYLSRCHYMLQKGLPVTDICYFIGEDAPKMTGILEPELPDGYDYDFINSDVIMNRLSVEDDLLKLSNGKTYELMVLPPLMTMRPEILRKIRELLAQGARIYGSPPTKSPSLEKYPSADQEIRDMSMEIWGDMEEMQQIHKKVGKGQLFFGQDLSYVVNELDIDPDVIVQDTSILWTHRHLKGTDIYFISNQEAISKEVELSFRIDEKIPEIWDPASGTINKMAKFISSEGRIKVPLKLDVHGSVFVVFRESINTPMIKNVTYNPASGIESELRSIPASITYSDKGNIILTANQEGKYTLSISDREDRPDHDNSDRKVTTIEVSGIPEPIKFDQNWNVRFPDNWDAPADIVFNELISWADHPHEGIRHFSGTASYFNTFDISEKLMQPDLNVILELGEVMVLAEIIVNSINLGILWKKPFLVDITKAVQAGNNEIEIRITNTWWNRLVGDEKYPNGFPDASAEQPRTYTTYKAWKAGDQLLPSGLLGPVQIYIEKQYIVSVDNL